MNLYRLHKKPQVLAHYNERSQLPWVAFEEIEFRAFNEMDFKPLLKYIVKDPKFATRYALEISQDRFPEAEPYIAKDAYWAWVYMEANDDYFENGWPEAEPAIMQDPGHAVDYAVEYKQGRWPEAEPYIMQDTEEAYYYAKRVIGGRWPEGEAAIKKDIWAWTQYTEMVDDNGFI